MPSHPPERSTWDAHQWDLDCLEMADVFRYGLSEAVDWRALHRESPGSLCRFRLHTRPAHRAGVDAHQEHHARHRTKNIMLHLLPFHHPVELAHRVAYLDHLAQGRYMFGIGSGGLLSDHELFDVDFDASQHREMTRESLDIILNVWEHIEGPFEYRGKFWNFNIPDPKEYEYATLKTFLTPYQKPHPPIGVAGASPGSETLKIVGERGYIPMSLGLNAVYVASHWDAVVQGAESAGREPPSRGEWRIVRDIWVADSDEEAREGAMNGMLGRAWRDYLHPLFSFGAYPFVSFMKHDESIPDDDVTLEYMMDNLWIVGSPDTVEEKLRGLYDTVGGFRNAALAHLRSLGRPRKLRKVRPSSVPGGYASIVGPERERLTALRMLAMHSTNVL